MRRICCVIVLALLPSPVLGQGGPVVDTLDWRGYYPLEVGNAWEWVTELQFFYRTIDRHEIVGDTLLDGLRYFVRQEIQSGTEWGEEWVWVDTTWVQYDTTSSSVVERPPGGGSWDELELGCDLGAAFGSVITCPWIGELSVQVWGGYSNEGACAGIGPDCAPYAAEKFYSWMAGGGHFLHGIGMVPGIPEGAQGGVDLTYVRVGGVEYGERAVYLGREEVPDRSAATIDVYPNPARDRVWLQLPDTGPDATATVFDVLGRSVVATQSCPHSPCRVDLQDLPPGLYLVRVGVRGDSGRVTPFIVGR